MEYIVIGDIGTPLLGVSTGEKYIGIDTLLAVNANVLNDANGLKFILNNGNIDLTAIDSDDLWAVPKVAEIYKVFKKMNSERKLTNLFASDLDNSEASAFKKMVAEYVAGNFGKGTGIDLTQLNNMFVDRYNFELRNVESGYFALRSDILHMENIRKNTDADVIKYIDEFLGSSEEVFENNKIVSDNQRVFFCATDKSVMPDYELVRGITIGELDEYRMKTIVPAYHRYLGPFMNYTVGALGSQGSYTDGEYIRHAMVAETMNSRDYKRVIASRRTELASQEVGGKRIAITPSVITGSDEYDSDSITVNEKDYYQALCEWEDMCIERDMLEAPIEEWVKLGLDIDKYLPELPRTRRVRHFGGISPITYDLVSLPVEKRSKFNNKTGKMEEYDVIVSEISPDGFTIADLAKVGLTKEVFKELNAGSPTSNKWFMYAINVALMATRYYTGFVNTPFGYDDWEFNKDIIAERSFRDKYEAYMSGKVWRGNRIVTSDELDERSDKNEESPTFEEYGDIGTEAGAEYWLGIVEREESSTESTGSKFAAVGYVDLMSVITEYIATSNVRHAHPEALIKCLRFGSNKPQSLRLDSLESRVNLTTGELITNISLTNPVELEAGKTALIRYFVTSNGMCEDVKNFLKEATGFKSFGDTIIGVGVGTRYKQPDGSEKLVIEHYDMQTLVNDIALQNTIANLKDGKIIESTPRSKSVEDVIQEVSRNVTTMSIQMNDAITSSVISGYQDKLTSEQAAYKILNNINKAGYNMFTFVQSLANMKELTKNIKFIRTGKVVDKLKVTQLSVEVQNLLNADTLVLYGGILSKSMQITAVGNEQFNKTFELWKDEVHYSLELESISSVTNTVNIVEVYRNQVAEVVDKLTKAKGVAVEPNWNIMALKEAQDSKLPMFYAMGNKQVTVKMIILSAKKITKDALAAYDANPSKNLAQLVKALVNMVSVTKNNPKYSSLPVEKIIEMMFIFVDDETKQVFTNLIVNNLKG